MARGVRQPTPTEAPLPKVSFQKVEDDVDGPVNGVHDAQARSYGYNDFSDFKQPDHYIRHIEPLEIDLARQVEYDMDEQDKEWLDAVNIERKKEGIDKVSYEFFEIVMDRLEKEWFDLTKNIPKTDFALPSEDSTCAICDDSEGENSNAIVFCDGCNLAVHQDCYGIPYIPEGQWLCRKCTVSPENPVSCILCPNEGGAFKQTVTGEWVHLLCAIWVPETSVANSVVMEPVTGVEKISKQRWKLKCSLCEIREGACIQCAKTSCFLAFHATCARKEKLLSPMKTTQGSESVTLTCYCERHLPKEQQELREAALAEEEEEEDEDEQHASKLNKSARAYAKTYKPGPPLVPNIIVDRITHYMSKVIFRKKQDFLLLLCRYWSLKREARRGAPLLKRLHLEPWTANSGIARLQTEEERAIRLEQLRNLHKELLDLKELTEKTKRRETTKYKQMELIKDVIDQALFPHEPYLQKALERIAALDRNNYFREPVNKVEVPDYYDVVKHPMCWTTMDEKLGGHEYWSIREFKDDVNLVFDNALLYNQQNSLIHKNAVRLKTNTQPILQELDRLSIHSSSSHTLPETVEGEEGMKVEFSTPAPNGLSSEPSVGELEPPLNILDLLTSTILQDELPFILNADHITSLLQIEIPSAKPLPPTPTPPPPPPPSAPKPKKASKKLKPGRPDRTEEYAKRNAKRRAERAERDAARAALAQSADPQAQALPHTDTTVPMAPMTNNIDPSDTWLSTASSIESLPSRPPVSSSSTSSSGARRRIPDVLSSHPQILDSIDPKESFTHFNSGWILPPDQKRARKPTSQVAQSSQAAPPPYPHSPSQPPPRKRMRIDPGSSRLSYSTIEEENQTLYPNDAGYVPIADGDEYYGEPMDTEGAIDVPIDSSSVPPEEAQGWKSVHPSSDRDQSNHAVEVTSGLNKIVIMPNGTRVLEELDTPAIRREKNMRKKAERQRLMLAASEQWNEGQGQGEASGSNVVDGGAEPVAEAEVEAVPCPGPSRLHETHETLVDDAQVGADVAAAADTSVAAASSKGKGKEMESELSSLKSEVEADTAPLAGSIEVAAGVEGAANEKKARKKKRSDGRNSLSLSAPAEAPTPKNRRTSFSPSKAVPGRKTSGLLTRSAAADAGSIILKNGETLPGGTLVWAKTSTWPWWPAIVFDSDHENVPGNVKELRQQTMRKSKDGKDQFIVQFFDKHNSWQIIPLAKLRLLLEDAGLDEDLLAKNSKRQKWKSANSRNECIDAYHQAVKSIEEG
ncbi:hypothetical protein D9758_003051 [Tetrapyrgos nigripes]|uniref:Peregrin n=1 Tax=Tetrapyrgos nigripes TaxID=182062 RepID=A0A8H5GPY8_9AGAR|nr:hypothetical protein D9758_003051 [Tetrapyrgos nigripes]